MSFVDSLYHGIGEHHILLWKMSLYEKLYVFRQKAVGSKLWLMCNVHSILVMPHDHSSLSFVQFTIHGCCTLLVFSVNRISTLRDFKCCLALKDLYLRKNCIEDLSELAYLQQLPNLRVLWLAENPCAYLPDYRNTVLRYLPNLLKLDNIGKCFSRLSFFCMHVM